jgi:hypothetical protein
VNKSKGYIGSNRKPAYEILVTFFFFGTFFRFTKAKAHLSQRCGDVLVPYFSPFVPSLDGFFSTIVIASLEYPLQSTFNALNTVFHVLRRGEMAIR